MSCFDAWLAVEVRHTPFANCAVQCTYLEMLVTVWAQINRWRCQCGHFSTLFFDMILIVWVAERRRANILNWEFGLRESKRSVRHDTKVYKQLWFDGTVEMSEMANVKHTHIHNSTKQTVCRQDTKLTSDVDQADCTANIDIMEQQKSLCIFIAFLMFFQVYFLTR